VGAPRADTGAMAIASRILCAALAACVLGALAPCGAGASAHLRRVGRLEATATATAVRLSWRDRSRGETRYEVRRGSRRVRLKAGRRRFTDKRITTGVRYRYAVRACRRRRCGPARRISVTPRAATPPATGGATPGGGGDTPATPGAPDPFGGSPVIGGCPVFPADNPWNQDISRAAVDRALSDAYIGSLGATTLWPDFGSGQWGDYGIPYTTAPLTQPLVPITFHVDPGVAAESDPGPYPIPPDARVEGGGDRHVLVLRQGDCRLFELYDAYKQPDDGWDVYSAATFDLRSNALRPDGYTSADAAGLPILPGLARPDEVAAGAIRHALRITVLHTQAAFIHPATHAASASHDPALPPMGLRVRLRPEYDISGLHGQARVIAQALKTYGALVADNSGGGKVFISGTPDPRWDDDDLDQLKAIPASALEAVNTGPLIQG
jgi:hypothetical protein